MNSETPQLTADEMYARVLANDAASNGRFFLGVLTTGIYCLPSCRARKPFQRNVRFYESAAAARAAGFRACLKCRPDDFDKGPDPVYETVETLAREVRERPGDFANVGALVKRSGYGPTRLFELFRLRLDQTPADYLLNARIEAAKVLLRTSGRPLTEIAGEVGFKALSAFHANFKRTTGETPAEYRCSENEGLAMQAYYDIFETPSGPFSIAVDENGAVIGAAFGEVETLRGLLPGSELRPDSSRLDNVARQLRAYFDGEQESFNVLLSPRGTPFQQRVWQALTGIPYGETRSYGELAAQLGSSARAVGSANAANPVCLLIPCHRVVGADGSLTGYAYGVDVKKALLELEKRGARREIVPEDLVAITG